MKYQEGKEGTAPALKEAQDGTIVQSYRNALTSSTKGVMATVTDLLRS